MKNLIIKKLAFWFRKRSIKKNDITTDRVLSLARAVMKSQSYCFLNTTIDGTVYSRVLQPFHPNENFLVRFGTSPLSRKVKQLKSNPRGTLSYLNSGKGAAVTLIGTFEIHSDLELRKKYFMPLWWAFFPGGPEGEDYVILSFKPDRIEIWDANHGLAPEPFGLKSAMVSREKSGQWQLEAN